MKSDIKTGLRVFFVWGLPILLVALVATGISLFIQREPNLAMWSAQTWGNFGSLMAGIFAPLAFIVILAGLAFQFREMTEAISKMEQTAKATIRMADHQEGQATPIFQASDFSVQPISNDLIPGKSGASASKGEPYFILRYRVRNTGGNAINLSLTLRMVTDQVGTVYEEVILSGVDIVEKMSSYPRESEQEKTTFLPMRSVLQEHYFESPKLQAVIVTEGPGGSGSVSIRRFHLGDAEFEFLDSKGLRICQTFQMFIYAAVTTQPISVMLESLGTRAAPKRG